MQRNAELPSSFGSRWTDFWFRAADPLKAEIVVRPVPLPSSSALARSVSDRLPTLRASAIFCAPAVVTSIVTELATLYGGKLKLANAPIGGLRAELSLPCG